VLVAVVLATSACLTMPARGDDSATPTWQLVFIGEPPLVAGLYVATSNTPRPRLLVRTTSALSPAWSPDGTEIVYLSTTRKSESAYVLRLGEKSPRRILTIPQPVDIRIAWPDGSALAFTDRDYNLEEIDPTGSGRRVVSDLPADHIEDFSWSPDARKFVVRGYGHLYVVPRAGGRARLVASGPVGSGTLSPDGRRIAYPNRCVALTGGGSDVTCALAVMNSDGSGKHQVLPRVTLPSPPLWSPGSRALYVTAPYDKRQGSTMIDTDTRARRLLAPES
jgi:TolB protein